MAQQPKVIEIEIDTTTGESSIDLQGMVGKACDDFTREYIDPLFGKADVAQNKPEYTRVQTTTKQKVKR